MEFFYISLLNGLSYGLLLFLLSSGLTLIFSMLGVVNFAHASFYMLGAYFAYSISRVLGFWPALLVAPLLVGLAGAAFERWCLRPAHRHGHVAELLLTFGLSFVVFELVQLFWGRSSLDFHPPESLRGPLFTLVGSGDAALRLVWGQAPTEMCAAIGATCSQFPATRAFMMLTALAMLVFLALMLTRTRVGLVVRAALTNPTMLQALGHDVDRVVMLVFGVGSALAGLAGVIGGSTFVTEPAMAGAVGSVVFVVVVVGGLGSLLGALIASLGIGLLQTFAVAVDTSFGALIGMLGISPSASGQWTDLLRVSTAQVAPLLPYFLLVVMLVLRPRGLLGNRET
ncbi:branched-chain amino acid ABC transporter permease [soil metagenome]